MNNVRPRRISASPINDIQVGGLEFKNKSPPIKAKMTSLDWVASTPASSVEVLAIFLANKNKLVAQTPDNNATSDVLMICD